MKNRKAVETAIIEGVPLREVAKRAGVDVATVHRHKQKLPSSLVMAHGAAEASNADDLLAKIGRLEVEAERIKTKAEDADDLRTALAGVRELTRIVELLARLRGELRDQTTVNILVNPQWINIRAVILKALEPYQEARVAVAKALGAMEIPPP